VPLQGRRHRVDAGQVEHVGRPAGLVHLEEAGAVAEADGADGHRQQQVEQHGDQPPAAAQGTSSPPAPDRLVDPHGRRHQEPAPAGAATGGSTRTVDVAPDREVFTQV
jgi:hypothetical protein